MSIAQHQPIAERARAMLTQLTLAESDVDAWKDRVAWSERMARKGFLSEQQLKADRLRLRLAEVTLDKARRELQSILPKSKDPQMKERKPEK